MHPVLQDMVCIACESSMQRLCHLQGVTQQLWQCAVTAYQQLDDQKGLYLAWCWMKDQSHEWAPASHMCYMALVRAVTALHSQPSQGNPSLDFAIGLLVAQCLQSTISTLWIEAVSA